MYTNLKVRFLFIFYFRTTDKKIDYKEPLKIRTMPDISSAVLSYLETLPCDKLIELINYLTATHEDIRLLLEEKAAIQTTKNKDEVAADKQ